MVHCDHPRPSSAECWRCGAVTTDQRLRTESILRTRAQGDGGPYHVWICACGVDCGVLHDGSGKWLLYPLEGFDEPGLLDRLAPRQSREAQEAAVLWWQRNRAHVERIRHSVANARSAAPPPRGRSQARGGASSRQRPRPTPAPAPPPPRRAPRSPRPPTPAIEERSAHDLLGVEPGAGADEIRSAYRKALKLCHPDRVANLDPEIQEVAHRKAKALRRAYEDLLGET